MVADARTISTPDDGARPRSWSTRGLDPGRLGHRVVGPDPPEDVAGGELTAGAVALPARDLVLSTAEPPHRPGLPGRSGPSQAVGAPAAPAGPLRIVVSRSRPPAFAAQVAEAVGGTVVPLGSAGAKAAAVILGEADAYLHDGGQHEWDSAAPVAVALAAGLNASRLDGSKLEYNKASVWQPDILICPGKLASRFLTAIGAARTGTE